jgi:hypothetical protein
MPALRQMLVDRLKDIVVCESRQRHQAGPAGLQHHLGIPAQSREQVVTADVLPSSAGLHQDGESRGEMRPLHSFLAFGDQSFGQLAGPCIAAL